MADAKNTESEADGKLKRKEFEQELARLHVEFVKLQQWVVHISRLSPSLASSTAHLRVRRTQRGWRPGGFERAVELQHDGGLSEAGSQKTSGMGLKG